jgi:hypothetical protein
MVLARSTLFALACGSFAASVLVLACRVPAVHEAVAAAEVAQVLATFRDSCSGGHVPPDAGFASERAWLARLDATG